MTLKFSALALPLIAAGTMATGQEMNYLSYGGSYSNLSTDAGDVDLLSFGAGIDYTNNNFLFSGGIQRTDLDGEVDLTTLNFRAGYFVTPDAVVYAGLDYLDADGDDLTAYNIGGEYSFGQFTAGLNVYEADVDNAETFTTLYGGYQVTNELELALFIENGNDETIVSLGADFEMGDTDVVAFYTDFEEAGLFAIAGTYDLGNGFRVGGNYANFDGELDIIAVSAGYEISDSLWLDASFGRLDAGGADTLDSIGLGITYETGRQTLLIDRAQTAQGQALTGIGSLLSSVGF